MLVFGGGAALAGLAGVIGGNAFVTEPAMAAAVGSIIFVVTVVGGMGSLAGAFIASLLIGVMQTFAIGSNASLAGALTGLGVPVVRALNSVNTALGFESGFIIVVVAIILDRMLRMGGGK